MQDAQPKLIKATNQGRNMEEYHLKGDTRVRVGEKKENLEFSKSKQSSTKTKLKMWKKRSLQIKTMFSSQMNEDRIKIEKHDDKSNWFPPTSIMKSDLHFIWRNSYNKLKLNTKKLLQAYNKLSHEDLLASN